MMRLGQQRYELVRSQSGFSVNLADANHVRGPQAWQLDLHYVPAETNPRPRPLWECEYLELCFQPFRYQTADWRELADFGPGPDLDPILFNITLGNLLAGGTVARASRFSPMKSPSRIWRDMISAASSAAASSGTTGNTTWKWMTKFPSRRRP